MAGRNLDFLCVAAFVALTVVAAGCSESNIPLSVIETPARQATVVPIPTVSAGSKPTPAALPSPKPTSTPASVGSHASVPDLASIPLERALKNGKLTLAEFGWRVCIPCKMMKPLLEELTVQYEGSLNVVIVEIYEQKELTRQYRIMAMPTQIFFDGSGREVTRHIGFWPKEEILVKLKKMGIQ
ncbi:MAG: thioredoxin domain-containing protein [Chloroflexota bacterium]